MAISMRIVLFNTPTVNNLRLWAHSEALQAVPNEVRQVVRQQKALHDIIIRSAVLLAATGFQRFEHEDDLQLLIEKRGRIVP